MIQHRWRRHPAQKEEEQQEGEDEEESEQTRGSLVGHGCAQEEPSPEPLPEPQPDVPCYFHEGGKRLDANGRVDRLGPGIKFGGDVCEIAQWQRQHLSILTPAPEALPDEQTLASPLLPPPPPPPPSTIQPQTLGVAPTILEPDARLPPNAQHSKFLTPLVHAWQSRALGYVFTSWRSGTSGADTTLDMYARAGDGAAWICGVIGLRRIGDNDFRVRAEFHCPQVQIAQIDKNRSSVTRVCWEGDSGEDVDVWDRVLMQVSCEADRYLTDQGLITFFGDGLELLQQGEETKSPVSVGLCITTKNRLWQLQRALPLNLLHCWPHRRWTRIHIVDFGSTDGTLEFLLRKCRFAIESGLLRVYYTDRLPYWHASIAKNTAHMMATEDILVNVDGDNLLGPRFSLDVVQRMTGEGYTVLQYENGEGTCGRIAYKRKQFLELRGYDEDCLPMGGQDVDLMYRLKRLPGACYRKVRETCYCQAIPNTVAEKISNCDPDLGSKWGHMNSFNVEVLNQRTDQGNLVRNLDRDLIGVKAWLVDAFDS